MAISSNVVTISDSTTSITLISFLMRVGAGYKYATQRSSGTRTLSPSFIPHGWSCGRRQYRLKARIMVQRTKGDTEVVGAPGVVDGALGSALSRLASELATRSSRTLIPPSPTHVSTKSPAPPSAVDTFSPTQSQINSTGNRPALPPAKPTDSTASASTLPSSPAESSTSSPTGSSTLSPAGSSTSTPDRSAASAPTGSSTLVPTIEGIQSSTSLIPMPEKSGNSTLVQSRKTLPAGTIVGIVIVIAAVALAVLFLLLRCRRHRRNRLSLDLEGQSVLISRSSSWSSPHIPAAERPLGSISPFEGAAPVDAQRTVVPLGRRQHLERELRLVQDMMAESQSHDEKPVAQPPQDLTSPASTSATVGRAPDLVSELQVSQERNDMLAARIQELEDQLESVGTSDEPPPGYSA
ncbi:hypothetical protein B0H19DRAFT_1155955 [Mycena capillaripes]|nr:hypothetical protein B0H19DRAFT_1155955 [Mycena capillaripes]